MKLIAALLFIGILALIFVAAAYFAESQRADQPWPHQRCYMYRFYGNWPDEPTLRRLSFRERIWYRAKLHRQLRKKQKNRQSERGQQQKHNQH